MSRFDTDGEDIFDTERTDTAHAIATGKLKFEWDPDGDSATVFMALPEPYKAEAIGTLGWDAVNAEWDWQPHDPDGNAHGFSHTFDMGEYDRREQLRVDRASALQAPNEITQDALLAELDGRVRMFRDETKGMAVIGTKMQANMWCRTYFCTGQTTIDVSTGLPDGGVIHDATTCPLHETGEPDA